MQAIEEQQNTLFDLSGKEYNAYWVDEKAPLFIPNNPLHWKAHKLQILVNRLEVQAQKNPAQFNSKNYIDALNELEKLMREITERAESETNTRDLADLGDAGEASAMGEGDAPRLDARISADNPTAR